MAFVIKRRPVPVLFSRDSERTRFIHLLEQFNASAHVNIYITPTQTIDVMLIGNEDIVQVETVSPQFNERDEQKKKRMEKVVLIRFEEAGDTVPELLTSTGDTATRAYKLLVSDSAFKAFQRLIQWGMLPSSLSQGD